MKKGENRTPRRTGSFAGGLIVIIGLLIGVFGVVLQAAWISWPAWTIAGLVMVSVWQWHSSKKDERTDLYLLENIKARCIGDKLSWFIKDSDIKLYTESEYSDTEFIAPMLGGIVSLIIFIIIQSNGWFSRPIFWLWDADAKVDPDMVAIAGFIGTAGIVFASAFFLHPKKTSENILRERADKIIHRINSSLIGIHELDSLESSIKAINAELSISFPADFRSKIQQFVDANTQTLLRDVTSLNKLIAEIIEQAKTDVEELEKASELYSIAQGFYVKTVREVSRIGSVALLTQLDCIHQFLHSENLKEILQKKDWSSFHDTVNSYAG